MPDLHDEMPAEELELLRELGPAWQAARRLENPPRETAKSARALFGAYARPVVRVRAPARAVRRTAIRLAFAAALLLLVFLALGLMPRLIFQSVLPGEALYPVKTLSEQTQLALTLTDSGKADLYFALSETRVVEIMQLANRQDPARIPETLSAFEELIQQGGAHLLAAADNDPEAVKALAPRIDRSLADSGALLQVIPTLEPTIKREVERAVSASARERQVTGQALALARIRVQTPTASPSVSITAPTGTWTQFMTFTATLTAVPTETPTATLFSVLPTETPAPEPAETAVPTAYPVAPTDTPIPVPSDTPGPTDTPTRERTSPTPTWTPTAAPQPTDTPTLGDTPVPTDTPAATDTPAPTDTPVPTDTPTHPPQPTHKPSNTPRPTHTPKP